MIAAIIPCLTAVFFAFAAAIGCYEFGHHVEHEARVAEVNGIKAEQERQLAAANAARAEAEQAARETEQKRVADMAMLDANYQKELSDAKAATDATIAELHAGTVRLRSRFKCPAAHPASVPSAPQAGASAAGADDGAGLQPADAGFLVQLARDADAKVRALQSILRNERDGE
jgi:hypothetical protein